MLLLELNSLGDLLSSFLLCFALAVNSSISEVAECDARLATQCSPDRPRQIEQQRLEGEKQRYPLIIADVVTWLVHLGIVLVKRQVVGIGRPAVL